ncbi:MAG: GatB/YqeY domain-containing protein [Candidatus Krumholzibacteriota bacterium]|nr:GatB/YqeY domain-containing protein [Candidatus Krumholzibacteriota bacterium]
MSANIIREKIRKDLTEAMKSRDKEKISALRMLISSLKNSELEKREELSEEEEIAVIGSYARKCRESISEFEKAGRDELLPVARKEYDLVMEYLPAQLDEDEIRSEIKSMIEETGASGPGDLGRIMGMMMKKFKGRIDGNTVREIAINILKSD